MSFSELSQYDCAENASFSSYDTIRWGLCFECYLPCELSTGV